MLKVDIEYFNEIYELIIGVFTVYVPVDELVVWRKACWRVRDKVGRAKELRLHRVELSRA